VQAGQGLAGAFWQAVSFRKLVRLDKVPMLADVTKGLNEAAKEKDAEIQALKVQNRSLERRLFDLEKLVPR